MKSSDLTDMPFRMNLTNNEKDHILDKKYNSTELKCFSFPHGIYEVSETNYTLKLVSPETVKNDIVAICSTTKNVMTIDTSKNRLLQFNEIFLFITVLE